MQNFHHLDQDELLSITLEAGSVITIDSGVAWMTLGAIDVIMRSGQAHTIPHDAEILVQAMTPSRLRLRLPHSHAPAWRRLWQLVAA